MKKIIAFLCIAVTLVTCAVTVNADAATQSTVITTTVPSTYVLTIPAKVDIPYGEKNATIGSIKVTGRITAKQYVKVTAETATNFCLVNDSDSSKRISYRPEDVFASAVNGSAPLFRGRDFTAAEVNGNGGSCLVVARISDYAWEHAAAGTYSDTITFTATLVTPDTATETATETPAVSAAD